MNGQTKYGTHINVISFSLEEDLNSNTCYKLDESSKHAKWNKPETKEQVLYDSTYTWYLNIKFIGIESRIFLGLDGNRCEGYCLNASFCFMFGMIKKKFCKQIIVMVAQQCQCT